MKQITPLFKPLIKKKKRLNKTVKTEKINVDDLFKKYDNLMPDMAEEETENYLDQEINKDGNKNNK
jgi:hypothetical protein